jgi:hypothetical protein
MSAVMQPGHPQQAAPVRPTPPRGRICDEMGICQAKPYPCKGCSHVLDAIERERRLQQEQQDAANDAADNTPTSFEQIVDWIALAAAGVAGFMTVLFLLGFAGYMGVKLGLIT